MAPDPIIQINGLHKRYDSKVVLRGIDLSVPGGQVVGYIGPNGAGKSTTVRILVGMDDQYDGRVTVAGFDLKEDALEVKKRVGYVPEQAELYEVLSPREYLLLLGRLHRLDDDLVVERMEQMLSYFGLSDQIDNRMDTFSKGMRQKVMIISGLLHDPQILFLDEPLVGLDANAVIQVKEMLSDLASQGKTIFYSSHLMDVVEKISDRIILINEGRIIADGPFERLKDGQEISLEHLFAQLTGEGRSTEKGGFSTIFESK